MAPIVDIKKRRAEFKKVALREAEKRAKDGTSGIKLEVHNVQPIFANIQEDLGTAVKELPGRVAIRLANEIKGGRSEWPVYTSYSQKRFKGDKRGIVNDASYSPYVEFGTTKRAATNAAANYVLANVEARARDVLRKSVNARN